MSDGTYRTPVNAHDQLRVAVAAGLVPKDRAVGIGAAASPLPPWKQTGWHVFSPFFQTDPAGRYYDNWMKTFSESRFEGNWRERRAAALQLAMDWAREQYGIEFWTRNRRGQYVPADVNERFPIPKENMR